MKAEARALQEVLDKYVPEGLAWARSGPACVALAAAEERRAQAAAVLASCRARQSKFAADREEAKRRSREEIEVLARSYFEGRPTSLWERLTSGTRALAGRSAVPATMEALGELIEGAVREAEAADREAEEEVGQARDAARVEEHTRIAWLITEMLHAAVPLLERQAKLGRTFAALDPEKATLLETIAFDAKWDYGHGEINRRAVQAVGSEVANA